MIELQVTGMSCGHCVKAVTAAIQQKLPQAQVTVELATGKVQLDNVSADGAQLDKLLAAIQNEGYAASVAGI